MFAIYWDFDIFHKHYYALGGRTSKFQHKVDLFRQFLHWNCTCDTSYVPPLVTHLYLSLHSWFSSVSGRWDQVSSHVLVNFTSSALVHLTIYAFIFNIWSFVASLHCNIQFHSIKSLYIPLEKKLVRNYVQIGNLQKKILDKKQRYKLNFTCNS